LAGGLWVRCGVTAGRSLFAATCGDITRRKLHKFLVESRRRSHDLLNCLAAMNMCRTRATSTIRMPLIRLPLQNAPPKPLLHCGKLFRCGA
jgi:hypothetical protein